ncbi:hypothetical protein Trco_006526 [Trichoderma cornu-damae]|uniref:Uncharacterized protein n=1 Tax=Trichoderma cornu-damae TaxID=654480 RepID=A0A9P8TTT9_9HYPO|nr:hypothetical protein Trco_006526 [Trichoderma cornu-damae]
MSKAGPDFASPDAAEAYNATEDSGMLDDVADHMMGTVLIDRRAFVDGQVANQSLAHSLRVSVGFGPVDDMWAARRG